MTSIDTVFLVMVVGIAAVSIKVPRALGWLAAMTVSYFVSSIYWRHGAGSGELVAGLCDAAVVTAIVVWARYRWEMWVSLVYLTSLLVNIVYLASNLAGGSAIPHDAYSITLEALNAAALFIIGGVAAFQISGRTDARAFAPWSHIFGFARPVGRTRY